MFGPRFSGRSRDFSGTGASNIAVTTNMAHFDRQKTFAVAAVLAALAVTAVAISGRGAAKTKVAGVGWYASFKDAQVEAKRTKKPILLLSMFGKLDEEMPCANARTLRATLFQDPEFKKLVTNDVIPAWEMVRAVPKVYIDLGDGKKLVRTVRGNAVMYLCNSEGKVIDAYPGVYTKADFMPMVRESIAKLANSKPEDVLAYHAARARMPMPARVTAGKAVLESPTLSMIGAPRIQGARPDGVARTQEEINFLTAASRIEDTSLTPMTTEDAVVAALGTRPSDSDPKAIAAAVMAADSQRNIQAVRPVVHFYFKARKTLPTPAEARDAVLETILKIPYKDPYFGLKDVLLPGTPN